LEQTAQAWSDLCVFRHSGTNGVGENIAMTSDPNAALLAMADMVGFMFHSLYKYAHFRNITLIFLNYCLNVDEKSNLGGGYVVGRVENHWNWTRQYDVTTLRDCWDLHSDGMG
jgi:hypothetical protein